MTARFVASAPSFDLLPNIGHPEIAFAGRSNVGKSTLLGMLLGQKKLVRTSKTPGQTKAINLFELDEVLAVVDLPGYGYAKTSKQELARLEKLIRGYLAEREGLYGVVLVVDARRVPVSPHDRSMLTWLRESGRPVLIAVTKIDTIGKNQRLSRLRAIEADLGVPAGVAVGCSGESGEGKRELRSALDDLSRPETAATPG